MRLLLLLTVLVGTFAVPPPAHALPPAPRAEAVADTAPEKERESWFSRDKGYHFAVSAGASSGLYALGRHIGLNRWQSATVSALLVGAAGVWREIGTTDRDDLVSRGSVSGHDLAWNAVGIVVGISLTDLLMKRPAPPE